MIQPDFIVLRDVTSHVAIIICKFAYFYVRSIILCCSGPSSFPLVYFLKLLLLNIIYWTYLKLYWVDKLVLLAYCCITLLNCLHNILFILQLSHSFTEKKLTFFVLFMSSLRSWLRRINVFTSSRSSTFLDMFLCYILFWKHKWRFCEMGRIMKDTWALRFGR